MKLQGLVFILFVFISSISYSQVSILNGIITSKEDIEREGLNIRNLSLSKGSVTNQNGEFRISAMLHDTLSISAIHIQTIIVIVEEKHIKEKKITINLIEKLNELEAVNLRRNSLTGYISNDVNNIPTKKVITAASLGLPNADLPQLTRTERAIYTATSSAGGIPIDPLINMISGRTKMLKKRLKRENKAELTLQLLERFPETYFVNSLHIKAEDVYSFIFFCEEDADYEVQVKQSTMEVIEFLERKSMEYLNERKS